MKTNKKLALLAWALTELSEEPADEHSLVEAYLLLALVPQVSNLLPLLPFVFRISSDSSLEYLQFVAMMAYNKKAGAARPMFGSERMRGLLPASVIASLVEVRASSQLQQQAATIAQLLQAGLPVPASMFS